MGSLKQSTSSAVQQFNSPVTSSFDFENILAAAFAANRTSNLGLHITQSRVSMVATVGTELLSKII